MKRRLSIVLLLCFLLTACTPAQEVPAPAAAPVATAAPETAHTPEPTASPEPLTNWERADREKAIREAAKNRDTRPDPIPFDPQPLLEALGCTFDQPVGLTAGEIIACMEGTALPDPLFYDTEPDFEFRVSCFGFSGLPIGGSTREAVLLFFDQINLNGGGTLFLFLRMEDGWYFCDDYYIADDRQVTFRYPLYTDESSYENGVRVWALENRAMLVWSGATGNTWLVDRWNQHGSGYDCLYEEWSNLHTGETDFFAILDRHNIPPGEASYTWGLVETGGTLETVCVIEELCEMDYFQEGIDGEVFPDRSGSWVRRYRFNPATYRLEPDGEAYFERASIPFVKQHILPMFSRIMEERP